MIYPATLGAWTYVAITASARRRPGCISVSLAGEHHAYYHGGSEILRALSSCRSVDRRATSTPRSRRRIDASDHHVSAPCRASYPHHLVTIFTELAEIDSVVDDIRKKTGRDRISLAGWSRSIFRFGLYATQHPDKVERLALVGPGYRRDAPSDFPIANNPSSGPSRTSAPQFSFFLRTADDVLAAWARQRRCDDTFDPGIHDAVTEAVRAYADPGAAMWGRPPGTFYRVANGTQVDAGWNRMSAPIHQRRPAS